MRRCILVILWQPFHALVSPPTSYTTFRLLSFFLSCYTLYPSECGLPVVSTFVCLLYVLDSSLLIPLDRSIRVKKKASSWSHSLLLPHLDSIPLLILDFKPFISCLLRAILSEMYLSLVIAFLSFSFLRTSFLQIISTLLFLHMLLTSLMTWERLLGYLYFSLFLLLL